MIYYDDDLICDGSNLILRLDLNDIAEIGEINYPFLNFNIKLKNNTEVKICLQPPEKTIEHVFFWKRRRKIKECYSLLLDSWNQIQEAKKEQPDWYLGG